MIYSGAKCGKRQKRTGREAMCNRECLDFQMFSDGKPGCLSNNMLPIKAPAEMKKHYLGPVPAKAKRAPGRAKGVRKVSGAMRYTNAALVAVRIGLQEEDIIITRISEKCMMNSFPAAELRLKDREEPRCLICGGTVEHDDYGRFIHLKKKGCRLIVTRFAHNACVLDQMSLPREEGAAAAAEA